MNPLYVASAVCTLALLPMQTLAELASADHGTAVALALAIGASICLLAGLYLQDDRRFLVQRVKFNSDCEASDAEHALTRAEILACNDESRAEYVRRVRFIRAGAESGVVGHEAMMPAQSAAGADK